MIKTKSKRSKGIILIRKSNDLIESRFKFDIWEMRIFLMLIAQIRRDENDFNVYRIWYRDVAQTFKLNKKRGYDMLRHAVKSLMNKSFYVQYSDNGKPREVQYHILRKIDYSLLDNDKMTESQEYVDVRIEEEMKPLLLQLQKSFTTYEITNVVHLGVYSIRIYELLKQYETIGHRAFEFEELKKMFELEKEYPRFATFYQRIIEPAVKEINTSTDLNVYEVEKLKNGKKVDGVKFRFRQRVETKLLDPLSSDPIQSETQKSKKQNITLDISEGAQTYDDKRFAHFYPRVVENMGITPTVFIELLKNYTDEQFEQAIRVTNRAKIEGQIKTSAAGFFVQALKNGYTDQKEERLKKVKKEETDKKINQQIEGIEYEKEGKIFDRIKQLTADNPRLTFEAIDILKNSEAGKKAIKTEEKRLNRKLDVEDFRQNKELRTMVIDALFQKNLDKFSDIIREYEIKMNVLKQTNVF
jgi:plasmid replication initiation protein